jgi:hypothetical protein
VWIVGVMFLIKDFSKLADLSCIILTLYKTVFKFEPLHSEAIDPNSVTDSPDYNELFSFWIILNKTTFLSHFIH